MSETLTFKIYGASDDLVETEGVPGCDEFGVYPSTKGDAPGFAGSYVLAGPGGALRVFAFYGGPRYGCWHFSVAQMDEGIALPDWPIRMESHRIRGDVAYSTEIHIDVPEGTRLIREATPDE